MTTTTEPSERDMREFVRKSGPVVADLIWEHRAGGHERQTMHGCLSCQLAAGEDGIEKP